MIKTETDAGKAQLVSLLRGLFADEVAVAAASIGGSLPPLFPEENLGMNRAGPTRCAEFSAGRAAARQAMRQLGLIGCAVPIGADRAPCWPSGVIGTLSHDRIFAVAALARAGTAAALGVDIEPLEPLNPELIDTICSPEEQRRIAGPDAPYLARLIFSAKEAAYKAQYPLTGQLFGFDQLAVHLDLPAQAFEAEFRQPVGMFDTGARLQGHFGYADRHLVTAVTIGQSAAQRER